MRLSRLATAAVTISAVAVTLVAPMSAYADTTDPGATDPGTTDPGTTGPSATPPPCAGLPSYVEGRPADLHKRGAAGDYLWHDGSGWHLRVTHRTSKRMVFRGVIVASAPMTFQRVRDEARDKVALSSDGTRMVFRFVNHGGIDGVDFAEDCAQTLKLALAVNGHHLNRNGVSIGAHSARPAHNPFVISRVDVAPAA
jgi:hypothetical protein